MTDLAPNPPENIKDATDQTFLQDVVEASNTQPVLVDFWAPWCGPCKSLTPVLEKVINSHNGKVKLVKVNIDENPGIAGQMGVRSIPAVFAFDKGRPVNGFQGALPEGQIRQFIDQILSSTDGAKQLEQALAQAEEAAHAGDIGTAAQIYGAVIEADPANVAALAGLARCYMANGDHDRARQVLDMAPEDKASDPAIKSVRTALDLMAEAPLDEDLATARETVAVDPTNYAARFDLAEKLVAQGRNTDAIDHLIAILTADLDWDEGKAKAKLLEIFEALGPKDPIAVEGRRRLGSLMFS
ncbi:MAG: thioredoxin [Henriciella sp.]|nr:thioredoxin [Henriciella sp.]